MKVSTAIKNLQELNPDEEIVINWFSKSTFEDYFNDEDPITDGKWLSLAKHLESADQFWLNNHHSIQAEVENWKDNAKYPTPAEMFTKLQETAPKGWIVSDEYHFIGVNHPALTQDQFIAFGNVNGCFGFNDENANTVCGDMEGIYNPDEIAESFWDQVAEFYPELFKESN